uniref:Si:ch211-241e1.3 n=1 Tax=Amphiprion percula TaxID=161767 RepID=A0A3P8S8R3_AMPPE
MLKKIQALLDQLKNTDTRGDTPNENLSKLLEDAERMVKEMEDRNFDPQKTAAEKERDEAKKLLDHIKDKVSKQCDKNEADAEKIRGLLKDYEAKLKDLDKALKEASDLVEKANAQNGLNSKTMGDLQKRIDDLKKERKTVEDQMGLAKNELQKTEDLVKKLTDSKTEYEQLAAQLDGAKKDLTKKVNEISKAPGKKSLVEKAEKHAKELDKLAKDLEDAVKNASGRTEVRNAKDAIDAYKNITDAINAADAAANQARNAADNALNNVKNQGLTERAKNLKESSDDLVKEAKDAEKDLKDAADDLNDLKKRLTNAEKKKKDLENDLLDAQNQLKNIKRDDIDNMINEAKRKAASANDSASDTMDKLNAIKNEIDKINVSPVDSNLTNVLNDVDQSVKKLLNTIPSLNDKISEVENLTSQFSPISNISENIKKIKELIEQARDAANRIGIPMKFKGDGHVELRPPKNLEDLKAYTSLSLSLQRPGQDSGRGDGRRRRRQAQNKADMFVLYLGNRDSSKNYIGMVLRNGVLYGVYKLNGVEYEMKTDAISMSASEPATFDRVDLRRMYQDAEMILTKDITSTTPGASIKSSNQGEENKNLLDISPSDIVFYVGGYPSDFKPPASLNYPMYSGCIEFSSFNDRVISLYNFQKAEKINLETPCRRYAHPVDSYYYEGTGYGKVMITKSLPYLLIDMSIFSRSENGLLLYIGSEDKYFIVTMEKGVIFIHSNSLQAPATNNAKTFPTSDWTEIQVIMTSRGKILVRKANKEVASAQAQYDIKDFKEIYIGGAPQDLRERDNITMQPFKGCLKNLKLFKDFKPVDETVGISKGCPMDSLISRKAEFSLGSSLSANLPGFSLNDDVTLSLGFKSTDNQGLILQDKQQANGINIALENGYVILNFNNNMWKSSKQYHNGQWHYVTITRRAGRIAVIIDDEDKGQMQSGSASIPDTSGTIVLGNDKFKGCVSNLYTRRPNNLYKAEDFSSFQSSGDILLDVCTTDIPAQLMLDRISKKVDVVPVVNDTISACALPALVPNAYRMGGPVSSLTYSLPLQVLQPRPHFSLDVRTRSPEGLLFFATTRGGRSHLALYMSKGRIRLSVGKQKEIFNREKYNDGKWHSVIFSLEKKKFRLVVDGIRAQDGQLTNAELTSMQQFVSPVYLGSAPESMHKELKSKALPKQSISGCVRGFKMNGAPMSTPTTNHGAGPCFEGQTQRGAYFSGNGAHVIISEYT